jgi:hypothetical protein
MEELPEKQDGRIGERVGHHGELALEGTNGRATAECVDDLEGDRPPPSPQRSSADHFRIQSASKNGRLTSASLTNPTVISQDCSSTLKGSSGH